MARNMTLAAGDSKLIFSARNQLKGKVSAIIKGGVNAEVGITLPGGSVQQEILDLRYKLLDRGMPPLWIPLNRVMKPARPRSWTASRSYSIDLAAAGRAGRPARPGRNLYTAPRTVTP